MNIFLFLLRVKYHCKTLSTFFKLLVNLAFIVISYVPLYFSNVNTQFYRTQVRQLISDFSVMTAVVLMVGVDAIIGLDTPKLIVPDTFKPTRDDRGWVINPFENPAWCIGASLIPALLATILIFMDQQITAVIVNRKENLLKVSSFSCIFFNKMFHGMADRIVVNI